EAGDVGGGDGRHRGARPVGVERGEEGDLAVAEHLHAIGVELGKEAPEREPGLLDARQGDGAVEAGGAGDESEPEERAGRLEQLAHRDRQYLSSSVRIVW